MGLIILGSIFIEGISGLLLFVIIGAFLAFHGVNEYLGMLEKINLKSFRNITPRLAAVILVFGVLQIPLLGSLSLLIIAIVAGWYMLVTTEDKKVMITRMVVSFSVLPALVIPLYCLALIYVGNFGEVSGRIVVFFLILVTKLGDVGAYTVGTISAKTMPGGNHKILPKISPKKSWEGTLGGLLVSIIASLVFCNYVPGIVPESMSKMVFAILSGALLFSGGFIGDLTESALKRGTGVKDSGTIIPGMGGALDVIDSLVLNAPLFYLFIIFTS